MAAMNGTPGDAYAAPLTRQGSNASSSPVQVLSRQKADVFAETNEFALSGRHPDTTFAVPSLGEAEMHQRRAEGVFR
jgi:hypothetical protein